MRFLSLVLLGMCACMVCGVCSPWSVCEVVVEPHFVSAVTVMHVLLFVLHVCVLREYEAARVTAILVWGQGEVWSW